MGPLLRADDQGVCSRGVVSGDGPTCLMDLMNAMGHCFGQGLRLPHPRVVAEIAKARGAVGILGTQFPNVLATTQAVADEIADRANEGFSPVFKRRDSAVFVDFYYNPAGYSAAESGSDLDALMWTLPIDAGGFRLNYFFDGRSGRLVEHSGSPYRPFAVRCTVADSL